MNWHRTLPALAFACVGSLTLAQDAPPKPAATPAAPARPNDAELVERLVSARKEYQKSLISLYEYYAKNGDRARAKWAEDELKAYHLTLKPSYRLDILDVPPPSLEAKANIKEANDLYKQAMLYKDHGFATEYVLNQRRAELLLQEVLQKHPTSDKIADVAYQLGDLYEGRAYRQFDRAAAYFERATQWRKGSGTDALLRAARIYDRALNERGKALELYRQVIETDTNTDRINEATRRRDELSGQRGS